MAVCTDLVTAALLQLRLRLYRMISLSLDHAAENSTLTPNPRPQAEFLDLARLLFGTRQRWRESLPWIVGSSERLGAERRLARACRHQHGLASPSRPLFLDLHGSQLCLGRSQPLASLRHMQPPFAGAHCNRLAMHPLNSLPRTPCHSTPCSAGTSIGNISHRGERALSAGEGARRARGAAHGAPGRAPGHALRLPVQAGVGTPPNYSALQRTLPWAPEPQHPQHSNAIAEALRIMASNIAGSRPSLGAVKLISHCQTLDQKRARACTCWPARSVTVSGHEPPPAPTMVGSCSRLGPSALRIGNGWG